MKRKAKTHSETAIAIYLELLAEEKEKPDTKGKRGRPKNARGRAIDRLKERLGYSSYHSAYSIVSRWEQERQPVDFETWGMELDPEFALEIRQAQESVGPGIAAASQLLEAMEANGLSSRTQPVLDVRHMLEAAFPGVLCPYCKAVLGYCSYCDGEGWYDEVPTDDPRLLDCEVQWVEFEGEVVLLSEVKL